MFIQKGLPEGYDIERMKEIDEADFKAKYQQIFSNSVIQEGEVEEETRIKDVVKTKKIDKSKFNKAIAAVLVFASLTASAMVFNNEVNKLQDVQDYQKQLDTAIGNHSLIVGLVNQNKEITGTDELGNPTTIINFEGLKDDITKVYSEVPEQMDMALYTVISDLGDENVPNNIELNGKDITLNRVKNSDIVFEDLYEEGIVEDLDTVSHMIRVVRENNGMPDEELNEIEKQISQMGAYVGNDYVKDLYHAYDKVSKSNIETFKERGMRL